MKSDPSVLCRDLLRAFGFYPRERAGKLPKRYPASPQTQASPAEEQATQGGNPQEGSHAGAAQGHTRIKPHQKKAVHPPPLLRGYRQGDNRR